MAGEKKNNDVILKGSNHTVTVEESSNGVAIVRLNYLGSVFRGALLNITNRNVPCGVNILRLQSNTWSQRQNSDDAKKDDDIVKENSSTASRFSYQSEPLPPLPEKTVSTKSSNRGYKETIVRNIRLRPRQVLCAKCKTSCSDTPKSKINSATAESENKSPSKNPSPPPTIPLKISLRKLKSSDSDKIYHPSKEVIQKTSPIIKISFNNPQGKGTVVNIPRKAQQFEHSESENEDEPSKNIYTNGVLACTRVKKSIKKAKDRLHPYNTKHGKHKKHKHKHERKLGQEMNPVVALSPLNLDKLNNENCEISVNKDITVTDDNPYRSPLRTKVIMKRERSASGSVNYVYQAQRVSEPQDVFEENKKSLTINFRRVDSTEEEKVDCNADDNCVGEENIGPLMMRIQTKSVSKVMLEDQRTICSGDIIWGKIHGFPWWPGRVESIEIGQKSDGSIVYQNAHVSWFGSSTTSNMACRDLYNFLEDFQSKFTKKKRGPYRVAIKEATREAKGMVSITEETDPQKSGTTIDDAPMSEVGFDVDVEAISSAKNSPAVPSECNSPAAVTPPVPPDLEDLYTQSSADLTAVENYFSPIGSPPPLPSPIYYSPISNTSLNYSLEANRTNSPLSTPKVSPIPYSPTRTMTPGYTTGHIMTSPHYASSLTAKYATAPTSPFYPTTTPQYPPVPMTSFHCSPAPVTSSYLSPAHMTSPYFVDQSVVTSPYYASAPIASWSPMHTPVTGSPKPLARYSPKYSPVTPTPSPLNSPVMASPVQCV